MLIGKLVKHELYRNEGPWLCFGYSEEGDILCFSGKRNLDTIRVAMLSFSIKDMVYEA